MAKVLPLTSDEAIVARLMAEQKAKAPQHTHDAEPMYVNPREEVNNLYDALDGVMALVESSIGEEAAIEKVHDSDAWYELWYSLDLLSAVLGNPPSELLKNTIGRGVHLVRAECMGPVVRSEDKAEVEDSPEPQA